MDEKPKRRWLAFNLRTLFVVLALVGVGLAVARTFYSARVHPGDILEIRVVGTFLGQPISGIHRVDSAGEIALGPSYGNVQVAGLRPAEVATKITNQLKKVLRSPEVSVAEVGESQSSEIQARLRVLEDRNARLTELLKSADAKLKKLHDSGAPESDPVASPQMLLELAPSE